MKLLVCGGRNFRDYDLLRETLDKIEGTVELAHGGASGADSMAGTYASARGWDVSVFQADWRTHGRAAGPKRNQRMLDEFKPDLVIAFPGGYGTADMVKRANKAGVFVQRISRATKRIFA